MPALFLLMPPVSGDPLLGSSAGSPSGLAATLAALAPLLALALLAAGVGALLAWALTRRGRELHAFRALAAEALQQNNAGFLDLAAERFRSLQEASGSDLDGRRKAIEELVAPLHEALDQLQQETREVERVRLTHAGRVGEQLRDLAHQTAELAGALRAPAARGRWGELTLRRTVELAGLSPHCDFAEQVTLGHGRDALRPDLVVRLPSGREVVVDAKAPLDAYLEASAAGSEASRAEALARHARQVRRHVGALAARGYAGRVAGAPEFVVLFLPHEGFLAAAVEHDASLVADALARGVVVATPTTLYALLAAVAQGWREQRLAENTGEILERAREMDERLCTLCDHLTRLGGALSKSVEHFNAAVGSFETRVLVQARRMRELGVAGTRDLAAPPCVDVAARAPARAPTE